MTRSTGFSPLRQHKMSHFGYVLSSESLGLVQKSKSNTTKVHCKHALCTCNKYTNKQTDNNRYDQYRHVWIESLNVTVLCTFFSVTTSNELVQQERPSPGTVVYPHMPILRLHASLFHGASLASRFVGASLR